jgi:SM-20-related protein
VEAQLTASNDGEFFRPHNDNAHEALERREMTFVYYFHCEPKGFRGGGLRIYESPLAPVPGIDAPHATMPPRQNQVVFFPSHLMHEVRPTHVSSRAFADSRFTVNGWLHR